MASTAAPDVLDILDPGFRVNSEAVREAAARHWYAQTELGPAILDYDDCAALLGDRRLTQGAGQALARQGITSGPAAELWSRLILNLDGPDHRRLRNLVNPAFTPSVVDRLRAGMVELVHGLVDGFAGLGRCEFITAFADHYPPRVIFDLLGLPVAEHGQFLAWGKSLAHLLGVDMVARHDEVVAAITGISHSLAPVMAARRAAPAGDLITALVAAADGGDRLSDEEIHALVVIMILGGQDSTRCSLGNALTLFADYPEQWAKLAEHPELAAAAVEEVQRVRPAVPIIWRMAAVDLEYKDLKVAAGDPLWLLVGHGQQFHADGTRDSFDITAEHRPQLTFGHGAHFCLGAHLARVEMAVALPILADRLPDLELDGEPVWRAELAGFVGAELLPIRFTPIAI